MDRNKKLENSLFSYISRIKIKSYIFIENEAKKRGITLSYSHMRIIIILHFNKKLSMKELTEKLGRDKSTVTALVNKLETEGYLKKTVCCKDKRITYLQLKEKSQEIVDTLFEVSEIFHEKVKSIIGQEDTETLYKISQKLLENWQI
ncbi:MAG: MarR family transcriptional regulator [Fusobacterium sp.]|uniref:MarR family winged helix-turn-helix transcriptional regulator n=1 Tax=Fusobacterium sp. SB021 TaxID=2744227 RepID=UPI001E0DDC28|nr:MarR family transcriptional regulator [Fusobacterium sp.]